MLRVLQGKLDLLGNKDIVVNAVHHGCMDPKMNATQGFSPSQAGEMVAGLASLPEQTTLRSVLSQELFNIFVIF